MSGSHYRLRITRASGNSCIEMQIDAKTKVGAKRAASMRLKKMEPTCWSSGDVALISEWSWPKGRLVIAYLSEKAFGPNEEWIDV